ncbi:L-histidine N(alpha)-methyltransferase [Mucilaginibacter gilvus]|uniref:L-histidine N(Alpha)-methyltransferase n=1 Tax=Mucilaginibacter gilvus TaxID=2305909 RepID=A0A3S3YVF2_9SPHI|nr:L-histidine N(alpha)-methyltransferase [Mucilaginibacter gilvus]RWY51219.1 L-histidine N(alpha)-methyltransferase [Mucilaginibacter gilvus]
MRATETLATQQFYTDVLDGLTAFPKHLPAKYFYDAAGDRLFQDIMNCPEYYVTDCELEIFSEQTGIMADLILRGGEPFDLIELGAGDCFKSIKLLSLLTQAGTDFTYVPIDISANIIRHLEIALPEQIPNMRLSAMKGDYFEMLAEASKKEGRKVILCLGANIGNMLPSEAQDFCQKLRSYLSPGDMVIVGFDLKKNPSIIRAAYDDREGITARFNKNLLTRINRELDANFDVTQFTHYCSYEPETGACKSFLISLQDQQVNIGGEHISFKKDEYLWMEISQKYNLPQIDNLALTNGFVPFKHLTDSKNWFTNAIWTVKQ